MISLRRNFNNNFKKILIILGIFLLLIVVVQILNNQAKINNEKKQNNIEIEDAETYQARDTVLSQQKVGKETNNEILNLISTFVNYCNNGKIEEAYNMLSSDCQSQMFPTKEDFKNIYYKTIFKNNKQVNMQSWLTKGLAYTYKVTLTEDMLSTGGTNVNTVEDYYTIIKESDTYKLNINNFIKKSTLNKSNSINNINITIKEVYIYMDYEIYNIEIKNDNNKKVLLDTKEKTNSIFVTDNNGNKYESYNYEISDVDLLVNPISTKNIKIKFSKAYNSNLQTDKLTFSDIVMDYNQYSEEKEGDNIKKIKIEIDI